MRRLAPALLALLGLLAGCIDLQESAAGPLAGVEDVFPDPPPLPARELAGHRPDAGDVLVQWADVGAPEHAANERAIVEGGELEAWVASLNLRFALPYDVPVVHAECGEANAYYSPEDRAVVLCWELFDVVVAAQDDPSLTREQHARAIGSAWLFVFIHELGHALVDAYDLPVVGREEDAVDDLATLVLIDAGASDAVLDAASFWAATDEGAYSQAQFADDHSLNPQRFYNILCTLYGSDPQEYAWLIDEGYLPAQRDAACRHEFERKDRSWTLLLQPWVQAA